MQSWLRVALTSLLVSLAVSCVTADEQDGLSQVDEQAVEDLDLSPEDEAALDTFGQQCGSVVCTGKTHCCNASCSKCVPFGMECTQEACLLDDAEGELVDSSSDQSQLAVD